MDGVTVIPEDEAHFDPGDILEDPARQEISQTSLEIFQLLAQCEGGKEVFGNIHEGNFIYDNASLAGSSSELSDIFQDSALSIANADTGHKLDDMVIKSIETSKQSPKKRLNAENNNHCARKRSLRKTKYCRPENDNSKKEIPKRKYLKDKIDDEKSLRQKGNLDKSSDRFTAIKGQGKVLYCKLCGRPFNNALSLQIHLTTHRQKVRLVKRDQTSKCDLRLKLENVTNFDPTFSKPQNFGNGTGGITAVSSCNEKESHSQKGVKMKVASIVINKKSESQCLENVCTEPSSNINSNVEATDSDVESGSVTVTGIKPMEHCRSVSLSNKSIENCRVTVVKLKPDSVLSQRITPSDTNTLKQTSGTKNIKDKRGKLVCKENAKINSKSNDTASRVVGQKSEHNRNASIMKRNQRSRVKKTKTQDRNDGENGTSDKSVRDGGNIFSEKSSSLMKVLDPLRSKRDVDLEMVSNSTDCFAIQDENPENVCTIDRNPETNGGLLSFDFEEVSKKVTPRTQKPVYVGLRPTECLDSVRNDCLVVRSKCDESMSLSDNTNIDRKEESFNKKVRIKRGRLVRGTPSGTCNRNEQIENDSDKCDSGKLLPENNVEVVSDVSENRVGNGYDKNSVNMKVTDRDRRETVISDTEQRTILKSKSKDCRTSADKRDSDIDMNWVGTDKTQPSVSQNPYCIDRSKNLGRTLEKCETTETEEQEPRKIDSAKSSRNSPCVEKKTGSEYKNRDEIVEDKRFINDFCSCDDINISGLHSERCNSVTEVGRCTNVMENTCTDDVYCQVGFESEKGQNSDDQGNSLEGMHANSSIQGKYSDSYIEEHDQCVILCESDCAFSDDDFDEHVPLILHRHTSRTLPISEAIRSVQYQSNREEELRNDLPRNTESPEAEKTELSSEVIRKLHTHPLSRVPDFSVGHNILSQSVEEPSQSDLHSQQNSTNVDTYNNEERILRSKFSNNLDIYIHENHSGEDLSRSKISSECNRSAQKDAPVSPLETESVEHHSVVISCSPCDSSEWNTNNYLDSTGLKENVNSTSGKQDRNEGEYMSSHPIADKSVNATVNAFGSVGRGKGDVNVNETGDVFINVEVDRKDDLLSNTLSESELEPDTMGYRNDMMSTCNVEGAFVDDIVGAVGIIPALENSSSCSNPARYMIHDYCARQISYQNFIQSKLEDYEYLNASLKEDSCARINTYHSYVLDKLKTSQSITINDSGNENIEESSDASQDCYNMVSRQMLSSSDVQMKFQSRNFTEENSYSQSGDLRPPAGEGEQANTARNDQSLFATEGYKKYTTETCVIDNNSSDIQNMCSPGSNAKYSDKQNCDDERSLVDKGKLGTEVSSPELSESLAPSPSTPDNILHIQIDKETAEKGVTTSLGLENSMECAKIKFRNASLSDESEFSVSVDSVSDSCARVKPFEVNIIHKFSEETKNILMEYQSRHQNRATVACGEDSTPEKSGVGMNIDSHTQTLSSLDENECIVYESHMIGSVSSVSTASKNSMIDIEGNSNPSYDENKRFDFDDAGLVKGTKTSASINQIGEKWCTLVPERMSASIHGGGLIPSECDTSRYSVASAEEDLNTNRKSNDISHSVLHKENILISDDEYRFVKSPKKQWYMSYIDTQSERGREDVLPRKVIDNVEITSQRKQLSSSENGNIETLRRNVDFGSACEHESDLEMCDSVPENESVEMSSLKHHSVDSDGSMENIDTEIVKSALNAELENDDLISVGDDFSNVFRDDQTIDFVSRPDGSDSDSDTSMADGSCSRSRKFIKRRSCARAKSYVLGCARSRTFVLTLNN